MGVPRLVRNIPRFVDRAIRSRWTRRHACGPLARRRPTSRFHVLAGNRRRWRAGICGSSRDDSFVEPSAAAPNSRVLSKDWACAPPSLTVVLVTVVATELPGLVAFGIAILTFRIFGIPWTQAIDQSHVRLAATLAIPGRRYGIVAFFVALLRYYDQLRARRAEVTSGA